MGTLHDKAPKDAPHATESAKPSAPGGWRTQMKSSLRGQPFAAQAASLSPSVQRKDVRGGDAATQTATTDSRLGYGTTAAKNELKDVDAATLPFRYGKSPMEGLKGDILGWNSQEILGKLTQLDESGDTYTDEVRCAANSALAIAIMAGPKQVEKFADRVYKKALRMLNKGSVKKNQTLQHELVLGALHCAMIPMSLTFGTATYADLSKLAHLAKVTMSKQATGFSGGKELIDMQRGSGRTTTLYKQLKNKSALEKAAKKLKGGEAYTVHVDTDTLAAGTTAAVSQGNHFVTLGKEPGKDGKVYLYDPYPKTGSQMMYMDDSSFWTVFQTADGRWKWSMLIGKTKPQSIQKEPEPEKADDA